MNRIHKQIVISYNCGQDFINLKFDMPTLTPNERYRVLEKLSKRLTLVNEEQILDTMSTLDIVKVLSKRHGVVCNSAVSDDIAIATIFIVGQEELTRFCAERFIELAAG